MQSTKIQMNKKKFRIGELAKKLKLKKFVIRFWEKEFELKSDRSQGGQRFYSQRDFQTFSLIKELLYERKFTIPGAKEQLNKSIFETQEVDFSEKDENFITPAKQERLTPETIIQEKIVTKLSPELVKKISDIKQKLINIKKTLD